MTKLSYEKYPCVDCGKIAQLVIRRGIGKRCVKCDYNHQVKLRTIRELNHQIFTVNRLKVVCADKKKEPLLFVNNSKKSEGSK